MENLNREEIELRQILADTRKRVIKKLDDLKTKIESDKGDQDIGFLFDAEEKLEEILRDWNGINF